MPSRPSAGRGSARAGWFLVLAAVSVAALLYRPSARAVQGSAHVTDGDSLWVQGVEIRLKGIDAPELRQTCWRDGQPYRCGEESRRALQSRIAGHTVACRIEGRDRYHRSLARCQVEGQDLGAWMVRQGLAVGYRDYEAEETAARMRAAGLWAGEFQRPSDWRHEHTRS